MKHTKKTTTATTPTTTIAGNNNEGGNVWVGGLFTGYPTKIQADPKFKELTVGAQNLCSLIQRLVPPGQGQADGIKSVISAFNVAAGELSKAMTLPSAI